MTTKLSPRMIDALHYFAAREMGDKTGTRWPNIGTLAALVSRGLVTRGTTHELTNAGRDVILGFNGEWDDQRWVIDYRVWYWAQEGNTTYLATEEQS
jgi:hypothetical protein